MHIKTSSMLPTTLLSLLLSSLSMATAIADVSRCVRENASILAQAAACTNEVSVLQECFLSIPDIVTADDLRTCFIERGCTIAEAASEAAAILQSCDASALVSDLRRSDAEPGKALPFPLSLDAKLTNTGHFPQDQKLHQLRRQHPQQQKTKTTTTTIVTTTARDPSQPAAS
ncbi:hypothetical protein F5Y08DRAFT_50588 [Xylaria arbuscula]|nr:hypothetical protein F5Y08DRAFT_50588 [Xylaria arbuscula]